MRLQESNRFIHKAQNSMSQYQSQDCRKIAAIIRDDQGKEEIRVSYTSMLELLLAWLYWLLSVTYRRKARKKDDLAFTTAWIKCNLIPWSKAYLFHPISMHGQVTWLMITCFDQHELEKRGAEARRGQMAPGTRSISNLSSATPCSNLSEVFRSQMYCIEESTCDQCSLYENSTLSKCLFCCALSACNCATMQTDNEWSVSNAKRAMR